MFLESSLRKRMIYKNSTSYLQKLKWCKDFKYFQGAIHYNRPKRRVSILSMWAKQTIPAPKLLKTLMRIWNLLIITAKTY